jgi:hypothetical protein
LGIQAALAGIAAVANNQKSLSIASRIRYLGSGEYLVKVGPDTDINPDQSSTNPFGWVPVHFDGSWTDNDPRPSALERSPNAKDAREFWTVLLHRAVTQSFNGSYDPFTHYTQGAYEALDTRLTNAADFIEGFTGAAPTAFALPGGLTFADLMSNLALGFWFSAKAGATPVAGVVANQFYAITKAFSAGGVDYVTLYNPSGFDRGTDPAGLPLDAKGTVANDGFITLLASDFFASFATAYKS